MSSRRTKRTHKKTQTFLDILYLDNRGILQFLTLIFMLMVIVGIPLYTKFTYGSIGTDKRTMFTSFLQLYWKVTIPFFLLHLFLLIMLSLKEKQFTLTKLRNKLSSLSFTDWCVSGYAAIVVISYLCSDYKKTAALGNQNWTMGALMQLSLAVGYFFISRFWKKQIWTALLMLPVSGLLFLLGYLNRFNLWPIPMGVNENPQFISLAGNINWYCGYLVTILFGAVYLRWMDAFSKTWQKNGLRGYLFVGFCALTTNGSSSGILTLLGIFFVLFLLSVKDAQKLERYCEIAMILGLSCLFTLIMRVLFPAAITYQETSNNLFTYSPLPIVLFLLSLGMFQWVRRTRICGSYPAKFMCKLKQGCLLLCVTLFVAYLFLLILNTISPGSIGFLSDKGMFTFSPTWGSRRGATWTAGAMAFYELPFSKKLIGVGPDCMGEYLYQDSSLKLKELLYAVWPNEHLINAHCEWLTILVNLGLLGLVSFAGIIITSVRCFLQKASSCKEPYAPLVGACGLAILAYSFHNLVSFQQILNEPAMFVILGIGAAYTRKENIL